MDTVALILNNLGIVIMLAMIVAGWYFGGRNECNHLIQLDNDELAFAHIRISSERFFEPQTQADPRLVIGSVVIAQDRFKAVIAMLLSLLGKNLTVYESLLERARREAIIRMKVQADLHGYNYIYGVRLEMSDIGANNKDSAEVEVIAYGTAIKS